MHVGAQAGTDRACPKDERLTGMCAVFIADNEARLDTQRFKFGLATQRVNRKIRSLVHDFVTAQFGLA